MDEIIDKIFRNIPEDVKKKIMEDVTKSAFEDLDSVRDGALRDVKLSIISNTVDNHLEKGKQFAKSSKDLIILLNSLKTVIKYVFNEELKTETTSNDNVKIIKGSVMDQQMFEIEITVEKADEARKDRTDGEISTNNLKAILKEILDMME